MTSTYCYIAKVFILISMLMFFSSAHAEGNCPDGYYPIGAADGQGGPQGCAPIPNYHPAQPPPKWAHQWGAIGTDPQIGKLGVVTNASSKSVAEADALQQCEADGGIHCQIILSYYDQCAVMILGDGQVLAEGAYTIEEATEIGLRRCSTTAKNCRVYYSACSYPKRIQ